MGASQHMLNLHIDKLEQDFSNSITLAFWYMYPRLSNQYNPDFSKVGLSPKTSLKKISCMPQDVNIMSARQANLCL